MKRTALSFAVVLLLTGAAQADDPMTVDWYRDLCSVGAVDQMPADVDRQEIHRHGLCVGFFLGAAKMYTAVSTDLVCEPNEGASETIRRMLRQLQMVSGDLPVMSFLRPFIEGEFSCRG